MRDALGDVASVLVLGASSELAGATVRALLARRSLTVVLAGRQPDALGRLAEELYAAGASKVDIAAFDARDTGRHPAFVDEVFDRHGDVDLVLVAFGVLGDQQAAEEDPRLSVDVAVTNYVGSVSVGLALAKRLRRQGHGRIVFLSSVAGERARRANFVYGSSKAGADAFFQGLGDSLAGTGAKVMVVRPGFALTKMTAGLPRPPLASPPEAVADAIVAGLRRDAEVVWVPASLRWVMTVVRHLPRPLFRRLRV